MPSINTPATGTVTVINADKGIKFYNPDTRQIEEVVAGTKLSVNTVLEFRQQGSVRVSFEDGQTRVISGSASSEQSIKSSLDLTKFSFDQGADTSTTEAYQPLPSLRKPGELTGNDFKPARDNGFRQPVVEKINAKNISSPYERVEEGVSTNLVNTKPSEVIETEGAYPSIEKAVSQVQVTEPSASRSFIQVHSTVSTPQAPVITGIKTDTGVSDRDLITQSTQFDVLGSTSSGTIIELSCNGKVISASITPDINGVWTYNWQAPQGTVDGQFNFTAKAIKSGQISDLSDPALVYVKTSAPELIINNGANTVVGELVADISGKTRGFNKVTLQINAIEKTVTAEPNGTFEFNIDLKDAEIRGQTTLDTVAKMGSLQYRIIIEDAAGNITTSKPLTIQIPTAPFKLAISPDTGLVANDLMTNNKELIVSGESVIGMDQLIGLNQPIAVQVGSLPAVQATLDNITGHWQTPKMTLPGDGSYTVIAWYGDTNWLNNDFSSTVTVEVSSALPSFDDPNFLATPILTNSGILKLDVDTEKGNKVTAQLIDKNTNTVVSEASAMAESTAHVGVPTPGDGNYDLNVKIENIFGNTASKTQILTVDKTAPKVPDIDVDVPPEFFIGNVSYFSKTQFVVKVITDAQSTNSFQTLSGSQLSVIGTPVPDGQGGLLYTLDTKVAGQFDIQASATDQAGNCSPFSTPVKIGVLLDPPAVEEVIIPVSAIVLKELDIINLQVKFDEPVKVTAQGKPKLKLLLDQKPVEADYDSSKSNDTELVFSYVIQQGDDTTGKGVVVPDGALTTFDAIQGFSGLVVNTNTVSTVINTIVVDTLPPQPPVINHLSNSQPNLPFSTKKTEFDVWGKSEPGTKVQLYDADTGQTIGDEVLTSPRGDWWVPLRVPKDVIFQVKIQARAVDSVGHESLDSKPVDITCDPLKPVIVNVDGASTPTEHHAGDLVTVLITFNETVVVSGDPKLILSIGNTSVQATLDHSYNTDTTLTFTYQITDGDLSTGSIQVPPQALIVNNVDSVKDLAGNPTDGTLKNTASLKDSVNTVPAIQAIEASQSAGIFSTGAKLEFKVTFDKPLTLNYQGGSEPKLDLTIGSSIVEVGLLPGTLLKNGTELWFTHILTSGQNGDISVNKLLHNGSMFTDIANQYLPQTDYSGTQLQGYIADTIAPVLQSIEIQGAPGTYTTSDVIQCKLKFSEPVNIKEVHGLLPQLTVALGNKTVKMTLTETTTASDSMFLEYLVVKDDNGSLAAAGPLIGYVGNITDLGGLEADLSQCAPPDFTGYQVDTLQPDIISISSLQSSGLYTSGTKLDFKVAFNKPLTLDKQGGIGPQLELLIGQDTVMVDLPPATTLTDATELSFTYSLIAGQSGDISVGKLLFNNSTFIDNIGQPLKETPYTGTQPQGFIADTIAPEVLSIVPDSRLPSVLCEGNVIRLDVKFSEGVTVQPVNGKLPHLPVTLGNKTVNLELPETHAATKTITLEYRVGSGDSGLLQSSGIIQGGKIIDRAGLEINLKNCPLPKLDNYQIDNNKPGIVSIGVPQNSGVFTLGTTLDFKVLFNQPLTLNSNGGSGPQLKLIIGTSTAIVDLPPNTALDKGTELSFPYTITAHQNGNISIDKLLLNGATFTSNKGVQLAEDSYVGVRLDGFKADTDKPVLVNIEPEGTPTTYLDGSTIKVALTFSEPVDIKSANPNTNCYDLPYLNMTVGGTPIKLQLPETTTASEKITLEYQVTAGEEGVLLAGSPALILNKGRIYDDAGLNIDLKQLFKSDFTGHLIHTTPPMLDSIVSTHTVNSKSYTTGDTIKVFLKFTGEVNIKAVDGQLPQLIMSMGGKPISITLPETTSASKIVNLYYKVVAGDNGTLKYSSIQAGKGAITDSLGLEIDPGHPPKTYFTHLTVDTTPPVLESVQPDGIGPVTYTSGDTLKIVLTFSEEVNVRAVNGKLPWLMMELGSKLITLPLPETPTASKTITLDYPIAPGDNGTLKYSSIQISPGTITDQAGLRIDLKQPLISDFTGHLIDATPSVLLSVRPEGDPAFYTPGDTLKMVLTFSREVNVNAVNGQLPQLIMKLGSKPVLLTLPVTVANQSITLDYKVITGDSGTPEFDSIQFGDGITDRAGLKADVTSYTSQEFAGYIVKPSDSAPDPVMVKTIRDIDGTKDYVTGKPVYVKVYFTDPVKVADTTILEARVGHKVLQLSPIGQSGKDSDVLFKGLVTDDMQGNALVVYALRNENLNKTVDITSPDGRVVNSSFKEFTCSGYTFNFDKINPKTIDSENPAVTDFSPETQKNRFIEGETVRIVVTLTKPVSWTASPTNDKPFLELKVGSETVKAELVDIPVSTNKLSFDFKVEAQHLDSNGIKITALEHSSTLKDASGNALSSVIDEPQALNILIESFYPNIVSAEGALIDGSSIMVTHDKVVLSVEVPDISSKVHYSARIDKKDWTEGEVKNTQYQKLGDKTVVSFDLTPVDAPCFFLGKLSIRDENTNEDIASKVYDIGYKIPSHQFTFDSVWPSGKAEHHIKSLTYTNTTHTFALTGNRGTDIDLVPSKASTGQALELNGGALQGESLTPVLKGSFSVCSWIQTNATGTSASQVWKNPSLIGKENPGSTDDIYLFTLNNSGHIGIALGDTYGAMSSIPVNDDVMRHICLTRSLETGPNGTLSTTQIYINGVPDGKAIVVPHKGHTSLANNQEVNRQSPEPELTAEVKTIGQTSTDSGNAIPFKGTIDDLQISPFAMDNQQVSDVYTLQGHSPLIPGEYQSLGLMTTYARPQIPASNKEVKVTFSDPVMLEHSSKGWMQWFWEKVCKPSEIKCQLSDGSETIFKFGIPQEVDIKHFESKDGFKCKPGDSDVTTYRASIKDGNAEDSAPNDVLILVGDAKKSGLYFDVEFHNGSDQSGNSPLKPNDTVDVFFVSENASLKQVGEEDFVCLDEQLPALRDVLGIPGSNHEEIQDGLNKLISNSAEAPKTHILYDPKNTDSSAEPIMSVETNSLDQPFSVYLNGDQYTINPDYIV